ncbi:MAG TPA: ATP-binding cassette domain-containing protein [Pseudonocardia sp.]
MTGTADRPNPTGGPDAVHLDGIDLDYRQGRTSTPALREVNIRIRAGQTLALLGPSGSGKSTALKVLAGFLRPTRGRVYLDGIDVTDAPPAKRGIGVVVQSYALFPHLRVRDNVAFGLRARRLAKDVVTERVAEALDQVGMADFGNRLPRELSGGQQQRVAIARALAIRPKVLLLDEPLAALDIHLRQGMLAELQRLRATLPDTAILFVTHDQSEALALADQIGVMRAGRLIDLADTAELWHRPPSEFTASFLGGANLLPATVPPVTVPPDTGPDGNPDSDTGGGPGYRRVRVGQSEVVAYATGPTLAGGPAVLAVRPHALRITASSIGPDVLPARVTGVQWRGPATRVTVAVDALPDMLVEVDQPGECPHRVDDRVGLHIPERSGVLVPRGESPPRPSEPPSAKPPSAETPSAKTPSAKPPSAKPPSAETPSAEPVPAHRPAEVDSDAAAPPSASGRPI